MLNIPSSLTSIFRYGLLATGVAAFWMTSSFQSAMAAPQNEAVIAPAQVIQQPSLSPAAHAPTPSQPKQETLPSFLHDILKLSSQPQSTQPPTGQQDKAPATTSLQKENNLTTTAASDSNSSSSSQKAISSQEAKDTVMPSQAAPQYAAAHTTHSAPIEIQAQPEEHDFSPWMKGAVVNILADQSPLEEVLKEFGNQMNIRVFSSPGIQGRVSGHFLNLSPKKFLDQLSRAYGLDWIYYNQQIYFSSSPESATQIRTLKFLSPNDGIKAIEQLGLASSGCSVRGVPGTPMLMLSGSPKFLEIAQQVIYTLEQQSAFNQTSEMVIQVFPLNYAWAYDVQLGTAQVRGVASTLSQLVGRGVGTGGGFEGINIGNYNSTAQPLSAPLGSQQNVAQVFPPATGGMQQGSVPAAAAPGVLPAGAAAVAATGAGYGPGLGNTNSMTITADVRSNSVIVRDVRANMPFYKAAIAKLDVPVKVVEISAAIVDADISSGRFLGFKGFDLKAAGGLQFSNSTTGGPIDGNIKLSGVYGTNSITAAIDFLEHNNKAKTLSRPTIVTLDNFTASIGNQETFYIKTAGGRDTPGSVYSVGSGLDLKVVPHITIENGQEQIYMQITIEDGNRDGNNTVGDLPVLKNTHLTTQSIVRRDQSLLIGGLYRTVDNKTRSGYPWLSKLPVVGLMFGSNNKKAAVVERMILLTPRIVDIYSNNLGNYSAYFTPSPEMQAAGHKHNPAPTGSAGSEPEVRRALSN